MIKLLSIVAVLLTLAATTLGQTPEALFEEANRLYENREYGEAIKQYEAILTQGMESPSLYFNVGNAYFKTGDLGYAVLNYLRADRLAPGDDDIQHNLEFARSFTSVQMEGVRLNPVKTLFINIVEPYRLNTLAWLSSLMFILLMGFLTIRYGLTMHGTWVKSGITVTLVLVVVLSFLTTFKYRHDFLTERGVLIAEDAEVLTGPSEESDVELVGAPGLVVEILDESGDYFNVQFENSRRGWVKRELVAVV